MNDNVIFLDTETTGLDPEVHEVWDIALIEADGTEYQYYFNPCHLEQASPDALRINKFYERAKKLDYWAWETTRPDTALKIAQLTSGKHLVGAVPSFDASFLSALLKRHKLVPAWHYHLVDIEALIAGKYGIEPPWDTKKLFGLTGVVEDPALKHTAMGDARKVKEVYESLFRK